MNRRYSELITLPTFKDRFEYLRLNGVVGRTTFASERYLNQAFYHSDEWQSVRNRIIVRDEGRDLGLEGFEIYGRVYVHHMNPITIEDVRLMNNCVLDPENLICVSYDTHAAIHYGDLSKIVALPEERTPNDTIPWR